MPISRGFFSKYFDTKIFSDSFPATLVACKFLRKNVLCIVAPGSLSTVTLLEVGRAKHELVKRRSGIAEDALIFTFLIDGRSHHDYWYWGNQ